MRRVSGAAAVLAAILGVTTGAAAALGVAQPTGSAPRPGDETPAAGAADASRWSEPVTLTRDQLFAPSAVALASKGWRGLAAWQSWSGPTARSTMVTPLTGGSWGPQRRVARSGSGTGSVPEVAVSGDGRTSMLVWIRDCDGAGCGDRQDLVSLTGRDGRWDRTPVRIARAGDFYGVLLSMAADGRSALVAWNEGESFDDPRRFRAARWGGAGWSPGTTLADDPVAQWFRPEGLRLSADGRYGLVAWSTGTHGGSSRVEVRRLAVGRWEPVTVVVEGVDDAADLAVSGVGIATGGNGYVAWSQRDGPIEGVSLDGAPLPALSVSGAAGPIGYPQVAGAGDGSRLTAVWRTGSSLWAASLRAGAWGPPVELARGGGGVRVEDHSVSAGDDGARAVVLWSRRDSRVGTRGGMTVWTRTVTGGRWTAAVRLARGCQESVEPYVVVSAAGNRALASWRCGDRWRVARSGPLG